MAGRSVSCILLLPAFCQLLLMLRWMEAQPLRAATAAAAAATGGREGGREVSAAPANPAAISLHPRDLLERPFKLPQQTPVQTVQTPALEVGRGKGRKSGECSGMFLFFGGGDGGTESLICGRGQPVKEWMKALCTELCPPQQQASSRPAAWSTTASPRPPPSHFNLLLCRATVNAVAQCQQAESVQRLLELLTFFQSASLARLSHPGEGGWISLFSLCLTPHMS